MKSAAIFPVNTVYYNYILDIKKITKHESGEEYIGGGGYLHFAVNICIFCNLCHFFLPSIDNSSLDEGFCNVVNHHPQAEIILIIIMLSIMSLYYWLYSIRISTCIHNSFLWGLGCAKSIDHSRLLYLLGN